MQAYLSHSVFGKKYKNRLVRKRIHSHLHCWWKQLYEGNVSEKWGKIWPQDRSVSKDELGLENLRLYFTLL